MLLACDPGKANFAYAKFTFKGKLKKAGMLKHPLVDFNAESFSLINKNFKIIKKDCTELVIERFIPRSTHKNNIGEFTNIHIGILLGNSKFSRTNFIQASRWKTYFNRNNLWIKNDSCPQHILDAIFIGLWDLCYTKRISLKKLKKLVNKIEKTNFNYYKFKNEWYYGTRRDDHKRGRKNSFGR